MWLVLIVRYRKTFPWSVATTLIKGVYFLCTDPAEHGELVGPRGTVIDNVYTVFQQQVGILSGPSNSPGKKSVVCLCRKTAKIRAACSLTNENGVWWSCLCSFKINALKSPGRCFFSNHLPWRKLTAQPKQNEKVIRSPHANCEGGISFTFNKQMTAWELLFCL